MRLNRAMTANGSLSQLYVVYDRAAEQCAGIFEAENDVVAARYYRRGMMEVPEHEFGDFSLVHIGSFDHKSMELIVLREKEVIEVPFVKKEKE